MMSWTTLLLQRGSTLSGPGDDGEATSVHQHKNKNVAELLTGTNNGTSIRLDMDFSAGVSEAEPTAGDDWYRVQIVVYPREVRHSRIEEIGPGFVPNARRPKRDASEGRLCRQIEFHEKRIEFCERSAERVANLQI
jgi:hypothetical protein